LPARAPKAFACFSESFAYSLARLASKANSHIVKPDERCFWMSNWLTILHRCQKVLRLPSASNSRACQFLPGSHLLSQQWIQSQPTTLWTARCYHIHGGYELSAGTTALRDDVLETSSPTCYPGIVNATDTRNYIQDWEQNFGRVFGTRTQEVVSDVFTHGSGWAEQLLKTDSVITIKSRWFETPFAVRRQRWPIIMLHCLTASARKTLVLLHGLPREPYMLFSMKMDCLLFLKRVYWLDVVGDQALQDLFNKVLSEMRRTERWPASSMKQRHLDLFLEEASPNEGRKLLDDFRAAYSEPSDSTMLRFMDFLTKTGDIEHALDCLQSIAPATLAASEERILTRCTNLLKLDAVRKKGPSHNFDILPRMLEIGIKPNLIIHNTVIKNAFRAGMSGVGWDLFHFMEEQGLPTDARTYLALLKDAFLQQNTSRLNELFSAIHQRTDLSQNTHIVAYTLNIVRLVSYQKKLSPAETLSNMLPMYIRAFNLEPLKRLGFVTDIETSPANANLPQPDPRTLAFTMWSYLLCQRELFVVNSLWHWLQRLVQAGDPLIVGMSQHDIIYNGFAVFYARKASGLSRCLAVVQHMLDTGCCKPTARTWGILLLAFVKHGRFDAAEKVKSMMSVRGVKPDEDTRRLLQEQLSLSEMTSHAREVLQQMETDIEPPQDHQMP
jgi:pentatricopeptide repeat protein